MIIIMLYFLYKVDKVGVLFMKFNYDIKNNFFKVYNIINGVYMMKKTLKKYPNKKVKGYVFYLLLLLLSMFLCFLIICVFIGLNSSEINHEKNIQITTKIFGYLFCVPLLFLLIFMIGYWTENKRFKKGTLVVEDDGLLDSSDGMTLKYDWNKIDFVFFLKDLVIIIPKDKFIIMYMTLKNPKRLLSAIKKKNKDILLIDQINL